MIEGLLIVGVIAAIWGAYNQGWVAGAKFVERYYNPKDI